MFRSYKQVILKNRTWLVFEEYSTPYDVPVLEISGAEFDIMCGSLVGKTGAALSTWFKGDALISCVSLGEFFLYDA